MFGKENQEAQTFKVGRQMLTESDLRIQIDYDGDIFTLKYPNPMLRAVMETEIARRLGGYPRTSHTQEHVSLIEACVTIDVLMIPDECPKWFDGPWKTYDDKLITKLFDGYLQFRNKLGKKLRSGGFEKRSKGDSS